MVRRISPSQLKSKLRQAEQKQRQAINNLNRALRQYNQKVNQTTNRHNQAVRAYNARVRTNRQRLRNELNRLNQHSTTNTRFVVYRTSVHTLQKAYTHLEHRAETQQFDPRYNWVLDLSEREAANSLAVTNRLFGTSNETEEQADLLENAELLDNLRKISEDLDDRWKGAVFALNPNNPDAARHFCTSAREIIAQIIDSEAPDSDVLSLFPNCEKTEQGKPTRRTKIKYFLHRNGMTEDSLEDFVEEDMENIVQLFRVFNDGTHGSAGTFTLAQLNPIKKRVEDGIMFLTRIIGDA